MDELTTVEVQMVVAIINAVQVPGKVVEQVAEIKRKLLMSLPAPAENGLPEVVKR